MPKRTRTRKDYQKVPARVVEVTFSSKLRLFVNIGPTDLGPQEPKSWIFKAFLINLRSFLKVFYLLFIDVFQLFSASVQSYCLIGCTTAPVSPKLQTTTAVKSRKLRPGFPEGLRLRLEARWQGGRRQADTSKNTP